MAGNLLMSISQNEVERAIFRSRRKLQTDYMSDMATARDNGRMEGIAEGRMSEKIAIARKMLNRRRPIDEIMEDTGLTRETVEGLQKNEYQSE